MMNIDVPRGLCITCIHVETRCWVRDDGLPIVQCEQFDSGPTGCDGEPATETEARDHPRMEYGDELGLCMNCDHRGDCSLPRPEGGVWHCEQYC